MIDPSIEDLLDSRKDLNIDSKFELITMISNRAKQLNNRAPLLVKTDAQKAVTVAIHEINAGKILPVKKGIRRRG